VALLPFLLQIEDIVAILAPLREVSKTLQKSKLPTNSLVLPLVYEAIVSFALLLRARSLMLALPFSCPGRHRRGQAF